MREEADVPKPSSVHMGRERPSVNLAEMLAHRSSLFQSLKKEVSEKLPLPTLKFVKSKFFFKFV